MASELVEARRSMTLAAIEINPATITIHRTTKTRSGGGFAESEDDLPAFTGRLFLGSSGGTGRDTWDAATRGADKPGGQWWLLAPHDADIQSNEDTIDTFELNGERYQVDTAIPVMVDGEVVSKQCALLKL
jgi:hypothetical protein